MLKLLSALALFALVVALWLFVLPGSKQRLEAAFSVPRYRPIDFAVLRRTERPNQFIVLPAGVGVETPDRVSRQYPLPPEALATKIRARAATLPDVTDRTPAAAPKTLVELVARTRRMRYPDLVTMQAFPAPDGTGSTLAIYSRSVYGYGDGGVNRKRVKEWLDWLDAEVARN